MLFKELSKAQLGHGAEPTTTLGPLQTFRGQQKARQHVTDATNKGAICRTVLATDLPACGYFFPPTLLTGCTSDMLVFQEESFAPIISIATFATEQEVSLLFEFKSSVLSNSYILTPAGALNG